MIPIRRLPLAVALAGVLALAARPAGTPSQALPAGADHVPGQVLVRFKPSVPLWTKAVSLSLLRSRPISRIAALDIYVVEIDAEASVEEMVELLGRNPNIAYAQPNHIYRAQVTPNDSLFGYQYALFNKGQQIGWVPGSPVGNPNADIKAPQGWEETTGSSSIIIGIVDTGIDLTHPDLKNKVVGTGRDFVNTDSVAADDHGHGTMVAGIAGAETDNGEGIAGVGWNCRLLPVKVLDALGTGTEDHIIQGILWAVENGAKVISLSFGAPTTGQALKDAIKRIVETNGAVVIAPTGNDNIAVASPASLDNYVLAVAATDHNDARWVFSNYGFEVDVAAPGYQIFTTYPVALSGGSLPYRFQDGTSLAAAHVAGLAGLILSLKPGLTPAQVMNIIRYSADDVNSALYKGKDEFIGWGRINMEKALVPLVISK
jgi:subtilisin family serine protease